MSIVEFSKDLFEQGKYDNQEEIYRSIRQVIKKP